MDARGHTVAQVSEPELITVDEAAARMRCSRRQVFRILANRRLVSSKVGRQRLITADSVAAYLDDGLDRP